MNRVLLFLIIVFLSANIFSQQIELLNGSSIYLPIDISNSVKYVRSNNVFKKNNLLYTSQNIQLDSNIKIDSIVAYYSNGTKERRLFTYNDEDKIESFVIQYYKNEQWKNSWKISNEYDSLGRQISRLDATSENDLWVSSFFESYFYDSFGNRTESFAQVYNIDQWENLFRITEDYDDYGNVAYSHTENWDGSNWVHSSIISISYFESRLKENQLLERWVGNRWQNYAFGTFDYDEDWKISEIMTQLWSDNEWVTSSRLTLKFNGNEKEEFLDFWQSESWNKYSRTTYTLNAEKYIDRSINEINYNGQWVEDDGLIIIENPDDFFQAFLASEVIVYYDPTTDIYVKENISLTDFRLFQNYPNPFNPTTQISYQIIENSFINLSVYNTLGQKVTELVNEQQIIGKYSVQFNASSLPSGVYFYKIEAGNYSKINKMLLLQ